MTEQRQCRHCKYSNSWWIDGDSRLLCLLHRRLAVDACERWEREPGTDETGTYIDGKWVEDELTRQ